MTDTIKDIILNSISNGNYLGMHGDKGSFALEVPGAENAYVLNIGRDYFEDSQWNRHSRRFKFAKYTPTKELEIFLNSSTALTTPNTILGRKNFGQILLQSDNPELQLTIRKHQPGDDIYRIGKRATKKSMLEYATKQDENVPHILRKETRLTTNLNFLNELSALSQEQLNTFVADASQLEAQGGHWQPISPETLLFGTQNGLRLIAADYTNKNAISNQHTDSTPELAIAAQQTGDKIKELVKSMALPTKLDEPEPNSDYDFEKVKMLTQSIHEKLAALEERIDIAVEAATSSTKQTKLKEPLFVSSKGIEAIALKRAPKELVEKLREIEEHAEISR